MKRRSIRRKIVNLSTMVDVFMIVIFWYIMFSNQNLAAQETAAQGAMNEMQTKYEEEIGGLNDELETVNARNGELDAYIKDLLAQIEQLENRIEEMQQEMDGLKESVAVLEQENAALKAENEGLLGDKEKLTGENEELKALMAQEGSVMIFQLSALAEGYYKLSYMYKGAEETLPFNGNGEEGDKLSGFITKYISPATEAGKINVMFVYGDETIYSTDVDIINETIENLQSENYFIYNKINLRK